METLLKHAEDNIAFSVALVSSFTISSFKRCMPQIPAMYPANVVSVNIARAIVKGPVYSNHKLS